MHVRACLLCSIISKRTKSVLLPLLFTSNSVSACCCNIFQIKDPDIHRPLTNQQIFDAVEEVLRDKLNITLNNLNSSLLKTATDEIVFGIPNAPDVLRIDYKRNALFQRRWVKVVIKVFLVNY